MPPASSDDRHLAVAVEQARLGLAEGGIPVGSALVVDGEVVGRGRNRRFQRGSAVLHAEIDALEDAGWLEPSLYARATLYTTLSPCQMCSGAVVLYGIPRVVIGDCETAPGEVDYLVGHGVEVVDAADPECITIAREFIEAHPEVWNA